ncbi:hypothetical protein CMV_012490 [Castanea mollissima]|uniref:TIP41-like protein n=1 Tax=Castanea mollissima TaxID=60419 RepID=A0A8J4QZW1_9ROSI|nr:hypothetical protein CMV_012490 [Castanea mollissima]
MAESLDDGEFWLPPEFLTDDDLAMEKYETDTHEATRGGLLSFEVPYMGFGSFGTSSDLSSPVESVVGSSETESDEEDYLVGLTRQMARSTLADTALSSDKSKAWVVSGSPQSTLCGCRQGSSNGSPNGPSQVSNPAATWDLLYAAAGEVARMRTSEEMQSLNHGRGGLFGPPRKLQPSPITVPVKNNSNSDVGIFSRQSLSHQQLQFQQLRHQQMIKQQGSSAVWGGQAKANGRYQQSQSQSQRQTQQVVQNQNQNRARTSNEFACGRNGRPLGLSPSAWPPLQQAQQQQQPPPQNLHNGSAMRAVFLANPGGRKESAGTGVFLPRRVDSPSDTRRKPGCSTVLVPARVVQALNLNVEGMMGGQAQVQPRFSANCTPDTDAVAMRLRSNNAMPHHQRRNLRPQQEINHEIRLPQEWTY